MPSKRSWRMSNPQEMLIDGLERTDLIETRFGELVMDVEEVEAFFPYRPEQVPENTVLMYFDWEDEVGAKTGRITDNTWEWIIEVYCHGYERRDVQRRMKAILLGIRTRLRANPKLDRAFSKPCSLVNMGPAFPLPNQEMPVLFKRFRLVGETEQGVA